MSDQIDEALAALGRLQNKAQAVPNIDWRNIVDDVNLVRQALERQRATNPQRFKCPSCGAPLYRVRQSSGSYLNADQFDAVRAGDWYCDKCSGTRGASGYRYYWNSEIAAAPEPSDD